MNLKSEHLIFRKWKEKDLEEIWQNVYSDEEIAKFMSWQVMKTKAKAKIKFESDKERMEHYPYFYLTTKDSDEVIGYAGIREVEKGIYEDYGIAISRKVQGHGLGKEIIKTLTKYIFEELKGEAFIYGCYDFNKRSYHCANSLGFKYVYSKEGIREYDQYHYTTLHQKLDKKDYLKNSSLW